MTNRQKKISNAAQIYVKEFELVDRVQKIASDPDISPEQLLKEYNQLGEEYNKLLKQIIKITRIGDANQRKLLQANEQIERQREELIIAYKKLDQISRTDPLTRLSNRRDFMERFQGEIHRFQRNKRAFSIVLGDIDDFKAVNDRYGHNCGDLVLAQIAEILRESVRKQDVVARWGGEEFILLLPESPMDGGAIVADSVRRRIHSHTYVYDDISLKITMTFGVSEFKGGMDADSCVKKADLALYQGKQKGKNCVIKADPT